MFMDGTSAHPQEAKLRYAAWAITIVPGGPGTLDNRWLMGGHVQGLVQTPFRAELTAALHAVRWAIQRGQRVRLWVTARVFCGAFRDFCMASPCGRMHHTQTCGLKCKQFWPREDILLNCVRWCRMEISSRLQDHWRNGRIGTMRSLTWQLTVSIKGGQPHFGKLGKGCGVP